MASEVLSERERIDREIFALRKSINLYLSVGNAEEANRMRDQIGDLERQIGQINKQEREAREEKGRQ